MNANLTGAELKGLIWTDLPSVEKMNIEGVKHAPAGFVEWALAHR